MRHRNRAREDLQDFPRKSGQPSAMMLLGRLVDRYGVQRTPGFLQELVEYITEVLPDIPRDSASERAVR